MSDFEFIPTQEQIENSNIFRFMKKQNITSIEDLSKKSQENLEWFWEEVEKDIGIVWDEKYDRVLDLSNGIEWPKWFTGGKTNIYKSSVEKYSKFTPEKTAYTFQQKIKTSYIPSGPFKPAHIPSSIPLVYMSFSSETIQTGNGFEFLTASNSSFTF